MTSVYVPREKENNLAAYMAVNSDATSDDFGKVSVLELPNEPTGGPLQIANTFATNEDVSQALLPYTTGDAARVPGNLLTLPVGDSFMYVQPVYTRREGESNFPILRFVLVSYEGNVGIGETLRGAIADSLIFADDGGRPPSRSPPRSRVPPGRRARPRAPARPRRRAEPPSGTTQAKIRDLLRQAEIKFAEADAAQAAGNTVKWARLMVEVRQLIEEAVELAR